MARNSNNQRGSSGQQSMMSGWADTAKERPIATAAAVGGAVAAGAFLWSRRNQISDQISQMSGQAGNRSETLRGSSSSTGQSAGRSSTPMGAEPRNPPEMAGAGTTSPSSSPRATGGRSGKAQSGDTLSPSRNASPTPGL